MPPDGPVADAATELARVLIMARQLTAEHDVSARPAGVMASTARSAPPWNPAAAEITLDAHAGIRQRERELRREVTGQPMSYVRGGTDANTIKALVAIIALCSSATPGTVRETCRQFAAWTAAAQRLPAIDEVTRWTPIRRHGSSDVVLCPYCQTPSLRAAVIAGLVACFNPGCQGDSDGRQPLARLDYSKINGDPVLAWRDGLVQTTT